MITDLMPPSKLDLSLSCLKGGHDRIPEAYRHLASFPVLYPKRPRHQELLHDVEVNPHSLDGLRIAMFVDSHFFAAKRIADFLTTPDKLAFLQTHNAQIDPKQIRSLFSTPCLDDQYLWTQNGAGMDFKSSSSAKVLRYAGLELCKALPADLVAGTVRRVLQGWMTAHPCHKRNRTVQTTLSKVKATFRPTADVWSRLLNSLDKNGLTLLTYAVYHSVPHEKLSALLQIVPCLDAHLPDQRHQLSPVQLAVALERPQGVLEALANHGN